MGNIERSDFDKTAEAIRSVQSATAARIIMDPLRMRHEAEVRRLGQQLQGAVEERNRLLDTAIEALKRIEADRLTPLMSQMVAREALDNLGWQSDQVAFDEMPKFSDPDPRSENVASDEERHGT